LISWKRAFKRLNEEFKIAKKKKQALDNLLDTGRISSSTHELFNKEIDEAIAEIEKQQKDLIEKMNSKMEELEAQIKTLEMLFANFEIQHVTGEVEEEVYERETNLLSAGLETTKHELEAVREALNQLSPITQTPTTEETTQEKVDPQPVENVETPKPEIKTLEEPAPVVEIKELAETQKTEEPQPAETAVQNEEKQEA
jgi:exonuclease VII large subunit